MPMSTGPDDLAAAARGHLRASRADRERVIAVLKTAFVQDRLAKDEFDHRVGQVLASRTYAQLAELTADIPAESPPADIPAQSPTADIPAQSPAADIPAQSPAADIPAQSPAAAPPVDPRRTLAKAARRSLICALLTVALLEGVALNGSFGLLVLAVFSGLAAAGFLGYGFVDARDERRLLRAQPPPSPGPSRNSPDACQPGPVP
jgi:Domain of unknown function (DUF1707)